MSEKKDEAFANFVAITGASEDRAKFFMESSNWDLDVALLNFYELRDGETSEESSSREDRPTVSQQPSISAPKKTEKKSVIKSTGNVRTLSNLKPDQDSGESSDEEEGQAFYAGGSEHSGQQVLGPPRGRRADIVSDMFRSVRAFGAEVVEPQSSSSRGRQSTVFGGTGYRLGETADDSQAVASKKPDDNSLFEITLKFWKNGFSVNDGPLRSYDDPKNQEILHHIKHGEIPNELIMQAEGREISFNLEDYRHSEYVGSASKTASFSGTGQKLGSVTPTLSSPSPASDTSSSREDSAAPSNPIEVDNSRPTTNIQIRLADGSRLAATFNHDHTIDDIRRYINAFSPSSRARGYILLSSFPRKELVKNEQTIAQAGLINSVVMQHLVA